MLLVLVVKPSPQLAEQVLHEDQVDCSQSTGQGNNEQLRCSVCDGQGLAPVPEGCVWIPRVLVCVPVPQGAEQALHAPQLLESTQSIGAVGGVQNSFNVYVSALLGYTGDNGSLCSDTTRSLSMINTLGGVPAIQL